MNQDVVTTKKVPKPVQAAQLSANGWSVSSIAQHFNWTLKSTSVAIAKGKNWRTYMDKSAKRNAASRSSVRPRYVRERLRYWARECRKLGINPSLVLAISDKSRK